jgi:hypothetical protein
LSHRSFKKLSTTSENPDESTENNLTSNSESDDEGQVSEPDAGLENEVFEIFKLNDGKFVDT